MLLEKHNTPSQEFHEGKTWQLGRPHLGICLLCEYMLFCRPQSKARLQPGCCSSSGTRGAARAKADVLSRDTYPDMAPLLQDAGQRTDKAESQNSPA